jgi:hypothetical protein
MTEITLDLHDDVAQMLDELEAEAPTAKLQLRNRIERQIIESYQQANQQGALE